MKKNLVIDDFFTVSSSRFAPSWFSEPFSERCVAARPLRRAPQKARAYFGETKRQAPCDRKLLLRILFWPHPKPQNSLVRISVGNQVSNGNSYPLARNQYINNSPGIFSCIRAGANTGATCIRTEMNSFKNLASMWKMIPQKYFPVFARVRIQAPHVFTKKNNSPRNFSCMYWFCAGGYSGEPGRGKNRSHCNF